LEHCAMKFNTAPKGLGSLSRFNTLLWEMSTFVKKKKKKQNKKIMKVCTTCGL